MASSVNAILDGFDYQALWFWWHVCQLLTHPKVVKRVGFEVDEYTAFDDIAVAYNEAVDHGGHRVTGLFYSVKYSVSYGKAISAESLGDPSLINADKISLLERLRDAVRVMEGSGQNHLFVLVAPWGLVNDNPIGRLLDTQSGRIRMEVLFNGKGPRSAMGKLRASWTKLLGLQAEEELRPVLSRLRIDLKPASFETHKAELSVLLGAVGLVPIPKTEPIVQYFPLIYSLRKTGAKWFDGKTLVEECGRQKLLKGADAVRNAKRIGIRSFRRFADGLGDQVDEMLCVSDHFDGRAPRHATTWTTTIPEAMAVFLSEQLKVNGQFDFHLHCFGSMAFLAGYLTEPSMGISANIVQRRYGAPAEIWSVDMDERHKIEPGWNFELHSMGTGSEWAIAVGVTHDVRARVIAHCRAQLLNVGCILIAMPTAGCSLSSVKSGTHAFALAEELKNHITNATPGRVAPLHVFFAAPNAFAFFLGQVSRPLGVCRLYEFDFDSQVYTSSLEVSPKTRLNIG